MNRQFMLFSGVLAMFSLSCCVPVSKIPLETVHFKSSPKAKRHSLVVFLPGRGSAARSFGDEGLMQELRRKRPCFDMVAVEAHLGYYQDRTLPVRLREDVILPARKLGYHNIWLVGISMGGLGALLYDTAYPGEINGICLLAPYLGEGSLFGEITRAGGFANWEPAVNRSGDLEREIWLKLAAYAAVQKSAARVYLGFGNDDPFAVTNRFFGNLLPPAQVVSTKGGHDWQTWRTLWNMLLDSPVFLEGRQCCSSTGLGGDSRG